MKTYLSSTLSVLGFITIIAGIWAIYRPAGVIVCGFVLLLGGARSARSPKPPVESRPQGPHIVTAQGSA
jgi:hypothetical protein